VSSGPREATGTRGAVREAIVRAAATCFGEMGYRATALETVAARAGISKVTLYKYVPGKEELLCRVFEQTIATFRTGLTRIVEQDRPVEETLRRIVAYQVTLLAGHLPFLTVFFSEESGLPPAMARRVAREKRQYDAAIERVVRAGIAAGRFRALDPRLVVFAIDGMCNWMHKWYRPDGRLRPEDIAAVFVDLLESGYLAPSAPSDGPAEARWARRPAVSHRAGARPPGRPGSDRGGAAPDRPAAGLDRLAVGLDRLGAALRRIEERLARLERRR
jgi:AcrR family transcriptional regulator